MLTQPAEWRPFMGDWRGLQPALAVSAAQWSSSAAAMPETRPLSAISHWRSWNAAMFMPKTLRQATGLPPLTSAKRRRPRREIPMRGNAGPGR